MQCPEAVIFDIGNVLIRWAPEQVYDQVIPDPEERARFFAEVDPHGMNDAVDRGAPFRETVYAHAEAHPQWRDMIRIWHDRWIEMASPAIEESVAVLRALRRQGIPVFALSNFGVESFAYAEGIYPFLKEFDRRFISGHLKVIKPEAEIYQILEDETGLNGAQLFFTDDRADNIAAAAERGWQVHQFANTAGLRKALTARGLSV